MDLGLSGKACIVTGASSGIGAATARILQDEGGDVLGVSRSGEFAVDVTEPDAAEHIVAECERRFGRVDVLVNGAGSTRNATLQDQPDEDWQEQWELNVIAPLRLMRAAAPRMAESGWGRIVNVASSAGKRPSLRDPAYSVTKAGQLMLSRLFADEWSRKGVNVNAVAPGPVASPMWVGEDGLAEQTAAGQGKTPEQVIEEMAARVPVGRLASPEEIAAVIVFLCSEKASNVTGAAWSADGGLVQLAI
jgi:NAD(P)-dependent dehydrogenase (short-subunit alcohol dehydrogenase family)